MVNEKYFTNLTTFYLQTNTWKKNFEEKLLSLLVAILKLNDI